MKEAIVQTDLSIQIKDSEIPVPGPDQVVIKVVYSGMNPKDWKRVVVHSRPANSGDDIAGYIHSTGSAVTSFHPGDRVAAFHEMGTAGGSFAEYALAYEASTFPIPEHISFQQAATLPLAAMTAAVGLFVRLGLPEPWARPRVWGKLPLLVYGGATAVGAFAIQFAKIAGLGPIVAVAGRGREFVEGHLDATNGDAVVDYRDGEDAVVEGIQKALKNAGCADVPLRYCFDAVSEHGSFDVAARVLDRNGGKATHVLPPERERKGFKYPEGIESSLTMVGSVHGMKMPGFETEDDKDFGYIWFRYFSRLLEDGRLKPHPYEERKGGLAAVGDALKDLRAGKASAVKYVFNVAETEGAEK